MERGRENPSWKRGLENTRRWLGQGRGRIHDIPVGKSVTGGGNSRYNGMSIRPAPTCGRRRGTHALICLAKETIMKRWDEASVSGSPRWDDGRSFIEPERSRPWRRWNL